MTLSISSDKSDSSKTRVELSENIMRSPLRQKAEDMIAIFENTRDGMVREFNRSSFSTIDLNITMTFPEQSESDLKHKVTATVTIKLKFNMKASFFNEKEREDWDSRISAIGKSKEDVKEFKVADDNKGGFEATLSRDLSERLFPIREDRGSQRPFGFEIKQLKNSAIEVAIWYNRLVARREVVVSQYKQGLGEILTDASE
jgi:hypothetical protein